MIEAAPKNKKKRHVTFETDADASAVADTSSGSRDAWMARVVRDASRPAVADAASDVADSLLSLQHALEADDASRGSLDPEIEPSIAGDTVADSGSDADTTAVAAKYQLRVTPREPQQGNPSSRGKHARHNDDWEVGDFGLFFGNWGTRGSVANTHAKRVRQETHDRQIMRCPGQGIVLCEATPFVEELLRQPPQEGIPVPDDDPQSRCQRLQERSSFEH